MPTSAFHLRVLSLVYNGSYDISQHQLLASGYLLKRTRYATFSGKFIHLWCIKTGKWYRHCALKLILLRRSFPGCSSSFWYDNFVCVILSFMLFWSQQRNSKHGIFNIRIFVQISVCPVNLSRKRFARRSVFQCFWELTCIYVKRSILKSK